MPDDSQNNKISLSRRKILTATGTIGASGLAAGLGSQAFFNDSEQFGNNQLVAGELDMKAAYSVHYSDWLPDENGVPEDAGVEEVIMFNGAPDTVGTSEDLPTGLTGLPANDAWLVAVSDPEQFLANTLQTEAGNASCSGGTDATEVQQPVIKLEDVKPGDFGEVTFDFTLCDNPGFVLLDGYLRSSSENGVTNPEADDGGEDQIEGDQTSPPVKDGVSDATVELLDTVQVAVWVDDGNNYQNGAEEPAFVGSLRDILPMAPNERRTPLSGDIPAEAGGGQGEVNCFSAGTTHSVAVAWWVPIDHGNEIQTDEAVFDLGLYTQQCRHNMLAPGCDPDVFVWRHDNGCSDPSADNGFGCYKARIQVEASSPGFDLIRVKGTDCSGNEKTETELLTHCTTREVFTTDTCWKEGEPLTVDVGCCVTGEEGRHIITTTHQSCEVNITDVSVDPAACLDDGCAMVEVEATTPASTNGISSIVLTGTGCDEDIAIIEQDVPCLSTATWSKDQCWDTSEPLRVNVDLCDDNCDAQCFEVDLGSGEIQ